MQRWIQQLGGVLIALFGLAGTAFIWFVALNQNRVFSAAGMALSAFVIVGLGLVIFPGYREERIARGEDISELEGMQLITARWWVVLVVALLVGFVNYVLLSYWLGVTQLKHR